jgi:hypothetical protein
MTVQSGPTVDFGTYTNEFNGAVDINGSITMITGIFIANDVFDATGGSVTFTGNGELRLYVTPTSFGTLTSTIGKVHYIGATMNVIPDTDHDLSITTAGTKTAIGDLDVNGDLITHATSGCKLDLGSNNLNIAGNLTVGYAGGLDASDAGCDVTFDGTSAQSISHAGSTSSGSSDAFDMADNGSNMATFNTSTVNFASTSSLKSIGSYSWWGDYTNNNQNFTQTGVNADLTNATSATFSFDHIAKTEGNYDKCYIYYSVDGGSNYTIIPSPPSYQVAGIIV